MRILSALLLLALSGCATMNQAPTAEQLATADYGAAPLRSKEVIAQYFNNVLKDPHSIEYRDLSPPQKGYIQHWQGLCCGGMKRNFGWMVNAAINAKNSYGGYVGFKTYSFLFRGDEIVDMQEPE